jgi:hypothetical protein
MEDLKEIMLLSTADLLRGRRIPNIFVDKRANFCSELSQHVRVKTFGWFRGQMIALRRQVL